MIQHRELFEKFLNIIGDTKDIRTKHYYKIPTDEENDDLIQLLIDLKVVDYDWNEMAKQTHRNVGSRIIEFGFEGDKVLQLHARVSGKNGIIKREALELISKDIGERFTLTKIVQLFGDLGVPESMFVQDTKWRAVFYVLSFFATSKTHEEIIQTLKIIEEFLHPLMFAGDERKAKQTQESYKQWLKYNRISIDDKGKVYLGPTEEEERQGFEDWIDANGEVIEPSGYTIFHKDIASLWTLLSQIVVVVNAYRDNSLNRGELEKLYLELIGEAEELIENAHVGQIKETYKRPFSSLHTAEIEAKAKGVDNPIELISALLVGISKLKPHPTEISKAIEHYSKLIARVASATNMEDFRPEVLELKNKARLIKDFNDCNFANKGTEEKIYLLKVLFSYYSAILNTYYGSGLFFLTSGIDDLNDYFKVLRKRMIEVIDSDETFLGLKENEAYGSIIQPLTSLYSGTEFFDGVWEDYTQPAITRFREEIANKDLFENNSEIHKTYTAVSLFLEAISGEIDSLKKYLREKTKNFYGDSLSENADAQKEEPKKQEMTDKKTAQTVIKNGVGYLLLNGGEIVVGPSKNIPFKLLEALCPLGATKGTNAIFNLSSSDRSKFKNEPLTLLEKQDILRTRIKELQEILRKKKTKVSLVFDERNETVLLKLAK